jgi:transcriptional regulator with XRE-family HTH domain
LKLLDHLKEKFNVKNDRQLAIEMGISHPTISRIRRGHKKASAEVIIAVHEKYGIPIAEIKQLCEA